MDFELIAAIIFIVFLTVFIHLKRKKLDTKPLVSNIIYFSMYRTSLGIKLMDSWAKKHFRLVASIVGIILASSGFLLMEQLSSYKGFVYYNVLFLVGVLIISGILLLFKPRLLHWVMIFIGFYGMLAISITLVQNIATLFIEPDAPSGVGLVLPVQGKGIFYVPFSYWIISIFVIAAVHEFAHGLIARVHNIKVKSSGFAFVGSSFRGVGFILVAFILFSKIMKNDFTFSLYNAKDAWLLAGAIMLALSYFANLLVPVIPAAFVEPNEKSLQKRPHKEQLSVFAAGPFSNILLALFLMLLLAFVFAPMFGATVEGSGVKITGFVEGNETYPARKSGISEGEIILKADDIETKYLGNLTSVLEGKKPGDIVRIETDKAAYQLTLAKNPQNESMGFMGMTLEQKSRIKDGIKERYGSFLPSALIWFVGDLTKPGLLSFLILLNLGIGLFNLVPLGPVDGGRMIQLPLIKFFGKERGTKIWYFLGMFFLGLILINLVWGFF